jgi:hypothetical protein
MVFIGSPKLWPIIRKRWIDKLQPIVNHLLERCHSG